MNLKGSTKMIIIIVFVILGIGLLPLLAMPLPYEGLDWIQLGDQIYYDTPIPTLTPTVLPTSSATPTATATPTPTATPTSIPPEPTIYLPAVFR